MLTLILKLTKREALELEAAGRQIGTTREQVAKVAIRLLLRTMAPGKVVAVPKRAAVARRS